MRDPLFPSQLHLRSFRDWLRMIFSGMAMGCTEMIPGVSGGTTAFILGFWHDLLDAIKSFNAKAFKLLFAGRLRQFFQAVEWRFLLALGFGNLVALILLAKGITYLLGHADLRSSLYGGFFGLIIASIIFCLLKIKHWRYRYIIGLVFGAAIAYAFTGTHAEPVSNEPLFDVHVPSRQVAMADKIVITNYDPDSQMLTAVSRTTLEAMIAKSLITPDTLVYSHAAQQYGRAKEFATHPYSVSIDWQLALFGALAIIAMLMPGISGSYVLVILGKYAVVIGALADFIEGIKMGTFDQEAFFILLSLAIGVFLGALLFARLVSALLHHYYNATLAVLIGFMIGALHVLWPFWSYQYTLLPLKLDKGPQLEVVHPIWPDMTSATFWIACATALLGVAAVFGLELVARRRRKKVES